MEFLMTYGWAILIMLVVIAVLFYLGILNPRGVAPNALAFPAGFTAYDYQLDSSARLYLDLGQATGDDITIISIRCARTAGGDSPSGYSPVTSLIPNGEHAIVANGIQCEDAAGTFYKGKVTVYYTKEGTPTFVHKVVGDLSHKIEAGSGSGGITPGETPEPTDTPEETPEETPQETAFVPPTPSVEPPCEGGSPNGVCEISEDCTCIDCDGEQDGCPEGEVCDFALGICVTPPGPQGTPITECQVISAPGDYYLANPITANPGVDTLQCGDQDGAHYACICIEADNVNLNCNSESITNAGIGCLGNYSTISNCSLYPAENWPSGLGFLSAMGAHDNVFQYSTIHVIGEGRGVRFGSGLGADTGATTLDHVNVIGQSTAGGLGFSIGEQGPFTITDCVATNLALGLALRDVGGAHSINGNEFCGNNIDIDCQYDGIIASGSNDFDTISHPEKCMSITQSDDCGGAPCECSTGLCCDGCHFREAGSTCGSSTHEYRAYQLPGSCSPAPGYYCDGLCYMECQKRRYHYECDGTSSTCPSEVGDRIYTEWAAYDSPPFYGPAGCCWTCVEDYGSYPCACFQCYQ